MKSPRRILHVAATRLMVRCVRHIPCAPSRVARRRAAAPATPAEPAGPSPTPGRRSEFLSLDDAVSRLEKQASERVAAVVRLRFYAGLSVGEAAKTLGVTGRTVTRDQTFTRAWLARELAEGPTDRFGFRMDPAAVGMVIR